MRQLGIGGELGEEPGAGELPIAFGGGEGDFEHLGDFVEVEAAEEAHFDDAGFAVVFQGELGEGTVNFDDAFEGEGAGGGFEAGRPGHGAGLGLALVSHAVADGVDEHHAHGAGGEGEEMGTAFPAVVVEPQPSFVDELGGLQTRLAGGAAEMDRRDFMEFPIDFVGLRTLKHKDHDTGGGGLNRQDNGLKGHVQWQNTIYGNHDYSGQGR